MGNKTQRSKEEQVCTIALSSLHFSLSFSVFLA